MDEISALKVTAAGETFEKERRDEHYCPERGFGLDDQDGSPRGRQILETNAPSLFGSRF